MTPPARLYLPFTRAVNTIALLVFAAMAVAPSAGVRGLSAGGVVLASTFLAAAARAARGGIELRDQEMVIRNIFTTWRIPREDVASAGVGPSWIQGGIRALVVLTTAGKRRSCTNMTPGSLRASRSRVELAARAIGTWASS
jgi:hypothetical protein